MRIIDITRPVFENMTVWPGDGGVLIERTGSINGEDVANTSRISIGVHTGTHVDPRCILLTAVKALISWTLI